jgi:hypothetical protein
VAVGESLGLQVVFFPFLRGMNYEPVGGIGGRDLLGGHAAG